MHVTNIHFWVELSWVLHRLVIIDVCPIYLQVVCGQLKLPCMQWCVFRGTFSLYDSWIFIPCCSHIPYVSRKLLFLSPLEKSNDVYPYSCLSCQYSWWKKYSQLLHYPVLHTYLLHHNGASAVSEWVDLHTVIGLWKNRNLWLSFLSQPKMHTCVI